MIKGKETIYFFEEKRRAAAPQGPIHHDGYAVTQNVSLVHVVGGQQDGPILLVLEEHVPRGSPRGWVHARCWLIKYHHLGTKRTIPRPLLNVMYSLMPLGSLTVTGLTLVLLFGSPARMS